METLNRKLLGAVILAALGTTALVGCATTNDDSTGSAEQAATPDQVDDVFEQVKTCDNHFSDRAAFRDIDLAEGVLRWKCGDVDGVTASTCEDNLDLLAEQESSSQNVDASRNATLKHCGDGFGQEYCEYNAVAKGNVVNSVKAAKSLKDSDVVECVFASTFSDSDGAGTAANHASLASELEEQLTKAERVPEGRVAGMKQSVNSRGAADTLIADCSDLGRSNDAGLHRNAERQVRCYRAWSAATSEAAKKEIASNCAKTDLGENSRWRKTGLDESAELSDADKDLAACTMVLKAEHGGVSWRNSDPTICARAYRATHECKIKFKTIDEVAPGFRGFALNGWTNRDVLPPGCKRTEVDGKPYAQLVVCTPNKQDVKAYRSQKKPLQALCRDKFGINVAMQAPIGALANLSGAKKDTEFCEAFVAGAKKAQR